MGWDLDLEEQRRIYKVLEKRASTGILPAEGVGYFYNSLREPDHVQGFNKIEESDFFRDAAAIHKQLLKMWKDLTNQDWGVLSGRGWAYSYYSYEETEPNQFPKYQTDALHMSVNFYDVSTLKRYEHLPSEEALITLISLGWLEQIDLCIWLFYEIEEQKTELTQMMLTGKLMKWYGQCMIVEAWFDELLRKEEYVKNTYKNIKGCAQGRAWNKVRNIWTEKAIHDSWNIADAKRADLTARLYSFWHDHKEEHRGQFSEEEWGYIENPDKEQINNVLCIQY